MHTFSEKREKAIKERYEKLRREDPDSFAEAVNVATALAHNYNWPLMVAADIEEHMVSLVVSVRDRISNL